MIGQAIVSDGIAPSIQKIAPHLSVGRVADAARLGLHWLYDCTRIRKVADETRNLSALVSPEGDG